MPALPMLAVGLVCACGAVLVWLLLTDHARRRTVTNLNRPSGPQPPVSVAARRGGGFARLSAATPASLRSHLDRLLLAAGRPLAWPMERVVAAKVGLLLTGIGLTLAVGWLWPGRPALLAGIILPLAGFFGPDLALAARARNRRVLIARQLPDILDQMSIAVQAGLGFDAAALRVATNGKGELATELVRTMQDIQLGEPRRQAYLNLGERTRVPELRRFVRSVVQSETYGLAVADVLHSLADEMRVGRRQRAEQAAMKIPVKVVFPLVLFILPVLFIVLLGPAAIRMIDAFAGGI